MGTTLLVAADNLTPWAAKDWNLAGGTLDTTVSLTQQTEPFVAELRAHGLNAALATYDGGHVFAGTPVAAAQSIVGAQEAWLVQAMASMGGSSGGAVASVAVSKQPRLMLAHAR